VDDAGYSLVAIWRPEAGDFMLPAGVGVPIDGVLGAYVQFDPALVGTGPSGSAVQTTLRIGTADSVSSAAGWAIALATQIDLPPHEEAAEAVGASSLLVGGRVQAVGALAWNLATEVSLTIVRAAAPTCVADAAPWRIPGPNAWPLSAAVDVVPGDALYVRCRYDTRRETSAVSLGDPPDGEECMGAFLVTR